MTNYVHTIAPKLILAGMLFMGTSAGTNTLQGAFYPANMSGTKVIICANNIEVGEDQATISAIERAVQHPELDENEALPLPAVIAEAKRILRQTEAEMQMEMPEGGVSFFYGELNITWRAGEDIVRLACFPNRPALIQVGSLSAPVGSYRSETIDTKILAAHLESLLESA
jgi:hypothetical protein